MSDDGLPAAVANLKREFGFTNDEADRIARAAREDVAETVREARADAWTEGFKAGRGADHNSTWWPSNPHRAGEA